MDVLGSAVQPLDQEGRTAIENESIRELRIQFPLWRQQLEDGFSLLFFGLGSKHGLLTAFAAESIADKRVVIINGADANISPARVLLFFELGSKHGLLAAFASESLVEKRVVTINGAANISPIAAAIASSCQPHSSSPLNKGRRGSTTSSSAAELARWITDLATEQRQEQQQQQRQKQKKKQNRSPSQHTQEEGSPGNPWMCIIVHSLDAAPMRSSPDCTSLLALLAASPAIAVIASVDHVLSSALFDHHTLSLFNFSTHHVVTRGAYTKEASAFTQASLSHAPSASAAAQAALLVLRSLPPNACQIFTLIAQPFLPAAAAESRHRGGSGTNAGAGGAAAGGGGDSEEDEDGLGPRNQPQALAFAQLYSLCRSRFLVTSELTLRAHLREFEDHALVKLQRQADGAECVALLLPVAALVQVMGEL